MTFLYNSVCLGAALPLYRGNAPAVTKTPIRFLDIIVVDVIFFE